MNEELFVTMSASVYMIVETLRRLLDLFSIDNSNVKKFILFIASMIGGVLVVFMTPESLELFRGTPLADNPAWGTLVLGSALGAGSKFVYILLDLLTLVRKWIRTDAISRAEDLAKPDS